MYYCDNCDIAHEERNRCPLCEAQDKIKGLEKEIENRDSATEDKKSI